MSKRRFIALPGLAARLRVAAIPTRTRVRRFGLKSFKALGGAYAVFRLLKQRSKRATEGSRSTADE